MMERRTGVFRGRTFHTMATAEHPTISTSAIRSRDRRSDAIVIRGLSLLAWLTVLTAGLTMTAGAHHHLARLGVTMLAALATHLITTPTPIVGWQTRSARRPREVALDIVAVAVVVALLSRDQSLAVVLLASAVAASTETIALRVAKRFGPLGHVPRVVVVGSGEVGMELARRIAQDEGASLLGVIDDNPGADLPYPVIGRMAELPCVISQFGVDHVVVAYSSVPDHETVGLFRQCSDLGAEVSVVPRMFQEVSSGAAIRNLAGVPVLRMGPRWHDRYQPTVTRALDLIVASFGLLVSSPLWLMIAIAIKIESRGPVFYRARRAGISGREFDMFKFRKMPNGAAGPKVTVAGDARLTATGRFLAKSKLDELPQLVNVLRGEMALVGPRPEDPFYVGLYPEQFARILTVKPGITGLTQIQYRDESSLLGADFENRYRNELLPEKISIDMLYADRRSITLDMRILTWTMVAIAFGASVERCRLTRRVSFHRAGE